MNTRGRWMADMATMAEASLTLMVPVSSLPSQFSFSLALSRRETI